MARDFINDNVHGRVEVTSLERAIINTPTFRRLSNISQLGFAYWVFPGARHSRASHSIGTLHVMSKLCQQLKFKPRETKVFRLAALLHDIGQYPFSHLIEHVYRLIGENTGEGNFLGLEHVDIRQSIQEAALLPPDMEYARDKDLAAEIIQRRPDLQKVFKVEKVTCDEQREVIQIIQGKHPCMNQNMVYKLLMDSDFDCDRLDYVVRDAVLTGVQYGRIELDYLIENMSLQPLPYQSKGSTQQTIAVNKNRALHALEHYLMARYYMYAQIVYHRTVRIYELLAKAIFLQLARTGNVYRNYEEIVSIVEKTQFLEFDDSYFLSSLSAYSEKEGADEDTRRLIDEFRAGERPALVREEKALVERLDEIPGHYRKIKSVLENSVMRNSVCGRAKVDPECVVIDEVKPLKFLPIGSAWPFAELMKRYRKDWEREVRALPCLYDERADKTEYLATDEASILMILSNYHLYLLRVFLIDGKDDDVQRLNQELDAEMQTLS